MVANSRELFIKLQAQNAQMLRTMNQAERSVSKFTRNSNRQLSIFDRRVQRSARNFGRFSRRLALASTAIAGSLVVGLKKAVDFADNIAKTARAAGFASDAFQEYRFAAERSGIATGVFDKSVVRLANELGKAKGQTGTLVETLKRIDPVLLSALQKTRDTSEALDLLTEGMRDAKSQSDATAIGVAGLGKAMGAKFAAAARQSSDSIEQLRQRARDLGLVLGGDVLAKAERLSDQFAELGAVIRTRLAAAIIEIAPDLNTLVETLAKKLPDAIVAVQEALESLGVIEVDDFSITALKQRIGEVNEELAGLFQDLRRVQNDLVPAAFDGEQKVIEFQIKTLQEERAKLRALIDDKQLQADALGRTPVTGGEEDDDGAAAEQADKIQKVTDALAAQTEQFGLTVKQAAVFNQLRAAGIEVTTSMIDAEGRLIEIISEEAETIAALTRNIVENEERARERARLLSEIKSVEEAVITEEERHARTLKELAAAFGEASEEVERYKKALEDLKKKEEEETRTKKDSKDTTEELNRELEDITRTISDGVTEALSGNIKGWRDWARFAVEQIAAVIRHVLELQRIQQGGTAGGGGSTGGNLLGTLLGLGVSAASVGGGSGGSVIPSTPGPIGGPIGPGDLPPGFARGQVPFRGRGTGTSDSNPVNVSNGEAIINARSTRKHLRKLRAINADRLPGFAAGGVVGAPRVLRAPNIGAMAAGISSNSSSTTFAPVININGANQSPQAIAAAVDQRLQAFASRANSFGRTQGQDAKRQFNTMRAAGRDLT